MRPYPNQAHMMPRSERFARLVQRLLPWYDPLKERLRDAHSDAIHARSIRERVRAEPIIAEYQRADVERRS